MIRRLDRYIASRTLIAFVAVLTTLTAIVWVTQALRRFDLVTAKGQAIAVYFGITLLALPWLIGLVAPFALVIAMVVVLNAMHADSELVAATAAGASPRQVLKPFIGVTLLVSIGLAWLSLISGPQALQTLRDMTNRVRADIVANVIQPGRFVDIDDDITFHIRNRAGDGSLEGLFIYDARDPAFAFTYSAERGRVVEALGRTLVVMENGALERQKRDDGATTYVAFGSYAFDLSELQPEGKAAPYKANERTIFELLSPDASDTYAAERVDQFRAEVHGRLATLLYPLVMTLAVFLFMGFPKTTRTGRGLAVMAALLVASLIRVAGFAVVGAAGTNPALLPLIYVVPLALLGLFGFSAITGIQPFMPKWLAAIGHAIQAAVMRLLPRPKGGRA